MIILRRRGISLYSQTAAAAAAARNDKDALSAVAASAVSDRVVHHSSRCNRTSTCGTQNTTTCVVRDRGLNNLKCLCTNLQSTSDCISDEAEAKADEETEAMDAEEEQEELNICDPNPCLNGICVVDDKQRNSFRCYCIPGFGGRLCDMNYKTPCDLNPCKNDGVCRQTQQALGENTTGTQEEADDAVRPYECLCRPGYTKDDCSLKVSVCQSNPCLHVCFDHGDYYVCECNPGFTGTDCDVLINNCESNPCQNDGACDGTPYGYSCQCPFGYHGSHCEQHALPDFLIPSRHPPQLHSLTMVGFTLAGAVVIAMIVVVCCYCNLGRFCEAMICTATLTKYEKQLNEYNRWSSISNAGGKRRRHQSLDGDSSTTRAFMDDDVETTSLQDRLFVEEDYEEDPTSAGAIDHSRSSCRDAMGSCMAVQSTSRPHLLNV